jgi:hypothetical protein
MYGQVSLSSLRKGLLALCTEQQVCKSRWEIDLDHAMGALGDITLFQLRRQVRCPQCNSPITTTVASPKRKSTLAAIISILASPLL